MRTSIVSRFFLLPVFLLATFNSATFADPAPPPMRDAFAAQDIDWDQTIEQPLNPPQHNHPNLSFHDGVLRAIGLVAPDGDGLLAHWGGGWFPGGGGSC